MRFGIILAISMLATRAHSEDRHGDDACASWQVEGIALGAPLAATQASFPEAKWRLMPSHVGPEVGWRARTQHDGRFVDVTLFAAGELVEGAIVSYLPLSNPPWGEGLGGRYDARLARAQDEMEASLARRLGAPSWESPYGKLEPRLPKTAWIDEGCDRVVLLHSGEMPKPFMQALDVRLLRASRWQAQLDELAPVPKPATSAAHSDSAGCSLLGVRLGMPLDELDAIIPGARKWKPGIAPGTQHVHLLRDAADPLKGTQLNVWIASGVVERAWMRCEVRSTEDIVRLQAIVEDRLHAGWDGSARDAHVRPAGLRRATWSSPRCEGVIVLESGISPDLNGLSPTLNATLARTPAR